MTHATNEFPSKMDRSFQTSAMDMQHLLCTRLRKMFLLVVYSLWRYAMGVHGSGKENSPSAPAPFELSPTLCLAESCWCAHSLRRSAFGVPQSAFAEPMLCTLRKSTIGFPQSVLAEDMFMYTLYGDLPWVHHTCACVLCLQWTYRNWRDVPAESGADKNVHKVQRVTAPL